MTVRLWFLGVALVMGCGEIEKRPDDGGDDTDDTSTDDDVGDDIADDGEPGLYRVYVDVTGLAGTLVLASSDGEQLTVTENGLRRFETDLPDGSAFEVTVVSDPEVQNCHVAAAAGTIDSSDVQLAVSCHGNVFMWIDDNPDGDLYNHELWMSDGTPEGTGRSLSINDDETAGTGPSDVVRFAGQLYLGAYDGISNALWRTDGTEANTAKVRDFTSLTLGRYALEHDGWLYFAANGDGAGTELWRHDGAVAERVTDIFPGSGGALNFPRFAVVGNQLLFRATDGTLGGNPWSYDLGTGNSVLLRDVHTGAFDGQVGDMIGLGDVAVFTAYDTNTGFGVWVTNGSPGGTNLIRDMNPASDGGLIIFLATDGTTAYFQGNDGTTGAELWKTDGTPGGTVQVKNINPGSANGSPGQMVAFAGEMWFVATDSGGTELWRTDGTDVGTQKLEVNPNDSIGSNPFNLKVIGDRLYFVADGGDGAGQELWKTDGTPEGTTRITDVAPGPDPGVGGLGPWDGRVLYFFDASYDRTTLWSTDGTPEGTRKVKDLCAGEEPCYPYAGFVDISE